MIRAVIFDMYETLITHYRCPLYFSAQLAADAGIPTAAFQALWRPTEEARTCGQLTLEAALTGILTAYDRYSDELLRALVTRRRQTKAACFDALHPEILPMLEALRAYGLRVGLISNCYSEEADAIRSSRLMPFFDAVCLSWEQGLRKPDPGLFRRCLDMLSLPPEECLYVGDGGSHELEAARALGMQTVQAAWYLIDGSDQPCGRLPEHRHAERPLDIPAIIRGGTCL